MRLRRKYFFFILAVVIASFAYRLSHFWLYYRIASDNDQPTKMNYPLRDFGIFKEVFQDPDLFLHNYAQMEDIFKVFIYPNKDEKISYYNQRTIRGMFSSEMFFHYNLLASDRFPTSDATMADLFFIPLTWSQIRGKGVYANSENYLQHVINEYPYWNQSTGIDHFFVTCHEDGESLSERVPLNNSIAVLCAANFYSRYDRHPKYHHITLPQIQLPFVSSVGTSDIHNRTTFAFWTPYNLHDQEKFKTSKYCICDGPSFLTRICITNSIHCGCVPVILYDDYELPFNYILDWTKFSVIIKEDFSFSLVKEILEAIPYSKFSELHSNIVKVQRHFEWNSPSRRYDAFHMIMYELWLRHLSQLPPSSDP